MKNTVGVWVVCVGALCLSACGGDGDLPPPKNDFSAHATLSPELQTVYDRTCNVCHGVAGTGAPAAGDVEAWTERGRQGMDALLDHVISGYRGMPPMGMCMECSQDDLTAFVEYMSGLECE